MTIKDINLILIFLFLSIIANVVTLRFYKKKTFIKEFFIFLFFYYICIYNLNTLSIFKSLLILLFFLSFFGVYTFTMIMPFEGSPSLILLSIILKEKNCSKKKLLTVFKKENFFKKRLVYLIQEKYIKKNNNNLNLLGKNNFFLKFAFFLESLQKSKNNG